MSYEILQAAAAESAAAFQSFFGIVFNNKQ